MIPRIAKEGIWQYQGRVQKTNAIIIYKEKSIENSKPFRREGLAKMHQENGKDEIFQRHDQNFRQVRQSIHIPGQKTCRGFTRSTWQI